MAPPRNQLAIRGKITRGALGLVIVTSALFLLWIFMPPAGRAQLEQTLLLTPAALRRLELWKLVTTGFLNPGALDFLLDVIMLWMFVPTLERWWGTRRFLGFVAATLIVGHLVAALVGLAIGADLAITCGLKPFIWGSIIAFGVVFASQPVHLFGAVPIKARSLAIGAAALMALMILFNRDWVSGAGAAAGMGLAWLLTAVGMNPRMWLLKLRRARVKRQLGVLQGGKAGKGKGKPDRWVN